MKQQSVFVSVDEKALETVSGGLLDILNNSLNCNTINVASGINVGVKVGDVLSNILNIANEVEGSKRHGG
jgi:hypothetical protein